MPSIVEVILSRRAVAYDHPPLPHEESGACVLAGLLLTTPRQIYAQYLEGPARPLFWPDVARVLQQAQEDGQLDRVISTVPQWPVPPESMYYGALGWQQAEAWYAYLRLACDAGYYGLANVSLTGRGPGRGPGGWVLLCGVRESTPPERNYRRRQVPDRQVLVSSPGGSAEGVWEDVTSFLRRRGGFNSLLARPL